jgi:hypothetical protein
MKTSHLAWGVILVVAVPAVLILLWAANVDVIPPSGVTHSSIHMCKRRVQRYAIEHNVLPTTLNETKEIEGFNTAIEDYWGHPILYSVDAKGLVTLSSYGKDNKPGGTGDDADLVGVYPSRQPNGKWSDESVQWTKDPFAEINARRFTSEPNSVTDDPSLVGSAASASVQTVRQRLNNEPSLRIYAVVFGVTAANSAPPTVRVVKVIDPKSGTIDAVKLDVPNAFVKAAKKKIETKPYKPDRKEGRPIEVFTYFGYVPGHPDVVVVDLDKPLDEQP